MSKVVKALIISAAATGAAALALRAFDWYTTSPPEPDAPEFPGVDPDEMSAEEVDALMNELASQLDL